MKLAALTTQRAWCMGTRLDTRIDFAEVASMSYLSGTGLQMGNRDEDNLQDHTNKNVSPAQAGSSHLVPPWKELGDFLSGTIFIS